MLRNVQWGAFVKGALLALPLGLVILAAAFAATPEAYRPFHFADLSPSYPVRISLAVAEEATARRDLSARRETALHDQAAQAQAQHVGPGAESTAKSRSDKASADQTQLATAGSDLAQQAPPRAFAEYAATGRGEQLPFYPYGFDLRQVPDTSDPVDLQIDVHSGQRSLGKVGIRITQDSSLYVSRSDILRLLPDKASQLAGLRGDYVLMSTLRGAGVDLRYNAGQDRLELAN